VVAKHYNTSLHLDDVHVANGAQILLKDDLSLIDGIDESRLEGVIVSEPGVYAVFHGFVVG
jgi:hypothetical protein